MRRKVYPLSGMFLFVVLLVACATPMTPVTIFTIGLEDGLYGEFTAHEFEENREYTCHVGVDCSVETFPQGLCVNPRFSDEVDRVTIVFMLEQDFSELVLRLVRAGAETVAISVDGQQTYRVTNTMLGSNENWQVGEYDLILGALKKGAHTLDLTVVDDGQGNGCFGWDALALSQK